MNNQGTHFEWQELKDVWTQSSQTQKITIEISTLLEELKGRMSQFEKDSIKSDMDLLKANWSRARISQFEKDSINRDLRYITKLLKRFLSFFKND